MVHTIRDFGPSTCAGWRRIAIPGPMGFWVYIVGTLLGGPIGAATNDLLVSKAVNRWKIKPLQ